jgi:hypothetical protein
MSCPKCSDTALLLQIIQRKRAKLNLLAKWRLIIQFFEDVVVIIYMKPSFVAEEGYRGSGNG